MGGGFYDLCVNFDGGDKENLRRLLARLHEMGYRTIAINQALDESALEIEKKKKKKGEKAENNDPLKTIIAPVEIDEIKNEFKDKLRILSRLTFAFSDITKTHTMAQSSGLKKFDIYGVIPKNHAALQFSCSQMSVDIVTLNPSHDGLKFSRKLYMQAVERGVHFEIRYINAINRSSRQTAIQHAHAFFIYGKSKSVIVSSGTSDHTMIRNPYDIMNLGALFGLSEVKARAAISEQCKHLILKAEGRRFGKAIFAIEIMDKSPDISECDSDEDPPKKKKTVNE